MKRTIFLTILLTAILALFCLTASAETYSGYCGGEGDGTNLTWELDTNSGILAISGEGCMKDYSASSGSSAPWNLRRYYVEKVVVEDGVTSIGERAFCECCNLITVKFPDSVTIIGKAAFGDCDALVAVEIPNSVITISDYAFENCAALTTVIIPDNVLTIGSYAFFACDVLATVKIGDGVVSIGEYAFGNSHSLTTVKIGDSVMSIGVSAFSECDALISVEIPNSVTTIGSYAFYDCDDLTTVTIHDSVQTIGDHAFDGIYRLTDVYYYGTLAQWNGISIGYPNSDLTTATRHYMAASYTANGDATHTAQDICADCGVTLGEAAVSACSDEDGNYVCDLCGGAVGIFASGYCGGEGDGTNLTWKLSEDGTLTISGVRKSGAVYDVPIMLGILECTSAIPKISDKYAFAG